MSRASGEYIMEEFPTTGEIRAVVILVQFSDVAFSMDGAAIRTLLSNRYNAEGYTEQVNCDFESENHGPVSFDYTIPGSARDYFSEMSMGLFTPSFDVIGPVELDSTRAYYGENTSNGSDRRPRKMIEHACLKAYEKKLTDFTDYDNDGNGVVDIVYVVYAGDDEAQSRNSDAVWAHAWAFDNGKELILDNGMKISGYACSGELVLDIPLVAGIGTFVHEFSHVLGLPDFYDTSGTDDRLTMDMWSVMDYGSYNADGFVPCAYTAFERYSLGWLPMYTLDAPATVVIGTTEEEKKGYRAFVSEADTASFYLFETIRWKGWNSYAPAEGLLISEVSYQKSAWIDNDVNVGKHRHGIVPANDWWRFKSKPDVYMPEYYPPSHLFGNTNHEFSKDSTPRSVTQFGKTMDKPLTDINYDAKEGVTTFHFRGGGDRVGVDNPQIDNSVLIYDLLGRPVVHPTKGIYIVNGKKTIIK